MFRSLKTYTAGLKLLNRWNYHRFFFIILLIFSVSALDLELPTDERDLVMLLEEELIDTLQYEQLLVYYALPVSVPQGELALLAELFPFLKDHIPDAQELEAYHPFDNRQIQKFFSDYPFLVSFQPILRFNVSLSSRSSNGEIVFGINKSKIDELKGQRVRFRQKSALISTDGSIVLNDSGAMFRNRRAVLHTPLANAELGNFKQPLPGELFFGNFSALTNENESVEANWLYGAVRGWNGAAVRTEKFANGMFGSSIFYHKRPKEQGAGAGLDIYALRGLRIHTAFTAFQIDSVNLSTGDSAFHSVNTAHFYAEYKNKIWRAVFETGLSSSQNSSSVPVSFRLNYRIKGSSAQYHLLMYPSELNAPLSRLRRQIHSEIGVKQYQHYCQIQKHSLKMTVPLLSQTKLIPEIDFTESGGAVKRIYGRTRLKTRIDMVDFSIKHSSKMFTLEADSVFHASGASVYLETPYPLGIRAAGEHFYGSYKHGRTSYSLDLLSSMLPNMIITPFIRGRYSVPRHQYWLGLKYELHLYQRNWSSIAIEIPQGVKGDDNVVYIRGSSSFTF
ncbi:MAG: hypothetical protein FWE57_05355 [Chitinispirillia bacterium]|nr:hypothetical protein [Chitinispirillia bacterium]